MRIGVISTVRGYKWAGSEELWCAASMRALGEGHMVRAILHPELHSGKPLEAFREAGGQVDPWRHAKVARLARLQERIQPNFRERKGNKADIWLVSTGSLPSLCYVPGLLEFLEQTAVPVVLLVQFNTDALLIQPEERRRVQALLERASQVVFVSEQNRQLAQRQYAVDLRNKSRVIYNPIRTQLVKPLEMPSVKEGVFLANVARFEVLWKAQDLLVEWMAQVGRKHPGLRLRFYGEGPDKEHVETLVDQWGLGDVVEFPGYVRDLGEVWSRNHILVLPSRGEGTPLAVLEAMMHGRPVVTTDVGGNAEVIESGKSGWVAGACTPASFGSVLETALACRGDWAVMGKAGHERARLLATRDPAGELLNVLKDAG